MSEKILSCSVEQLSESWRFWLEDKSLQSTLRFGQYIWNKFGKVGKTWPALFYETDRGRAWDMIYQHITN